MDEPPSIYSMDPNSCYPPYHEKDSNIAAKYHHSPFPVSSRLYWKPTAIQKQGSINCPSQLRPGWLKPLWHVLHSLIFSSLVWFRNDIMSDACHIDKVNYVLSVGLIEREISETSFYPFPSLTAVKMIKMMRSLPLLKVAFVLWWKHLVRLAALLQKQMILFVRSKLERSLLCAAVNYNQLRTLVPRKLQHITDVSLFFLNNWTILLFKYI